MIEAPARGRFAAYLLLALGVLLASTLSVATAHAAPGPSSLDGLTSTDIFDMFTTDHGDGFTSVFLNQLFGPLFPAIDQSATSTVFSEIIGYFNLIILLIGGILFFYNVTVGIMQSAHEGQVLGQRWSSLWAPLRVIFAVGLLVPVPGLGGYNLVQSGVAFIVKGSTVMASRIWAASAEFVVSGEFPITGEAPAIAPNLFASLYNNAACMEIVQNQLNIAGAANGTTPLQVGFVGTSAEGRDIQTSAVLGGPGGPQNPGICGSYSTPSIPRYITAIADPAQHAGLPQNAAVKNQLRTIFTQTHGAALERVMADMRQVAHDNLAIARDPTLPLPDESADIVATINATKAIMAGGMDQIRTIALGADRQGQSARDNLLARIRGTCVTGSDGEQVARCYGEGWIGAGSWYMMLAQLNNEMATLTEAQPKVEEGSYVTKIEAGNEDLYVQSGGQSGWFGIGDRDRARNAGMMTQEEATIMQSRYTSLFNNSTAGLAALGMQLSSHDLRKLNEEVTSEGILEKIPGLRASLQVATERMVARFSPSGSTLGSADPMVGLTEIGKLLVNLSGVIMAVAGLSGFFTGGGVATMLMPIVSVLMTAGSTLAYILPLMPFTLWVLAVTGFFLLIVEAVVAVNLWALAHMRMDGDGISGEAGRQGWLMMLSLFLTPVLMIFGFLIGMGIFRVTSALLDVGFRQAISGIMGGGVFNGLVALLIYSVLITVMYMVIIERSFSLVTEFPGRVLQLMGASAEITRGEENRARMAMGTAAASVYGGSSRAGTALAGAARGSVAAGNFVRQRKSRNVTNGSPPGGGAPPAGGTAPPAAGG